MQPQKLQPAKRVEYVPAHAHSPGGGAKEEGRKGGDVGAVGSR